LPQAGIGRAVGASHWNEEESIDRSASRDEGCGNKGCSRGGREQKRDFPFIRRAALTLKVRLSAVAAKRLLFSHAIPAVDRSPSRHTSHHALRTIRIFSLHFFPEPAIELRVTEG
jgi:hypothetical protein